MEIFMYYIIFFFFVLILLLKYDGWWIIFVNDDYIEIFNYMYKDFCIFKVILNIKFVRLKNVCKINEN